MAHIVFFEPFHGGSHQDFVAGLMQFSRHRITLVPLPARHWKWRMRGAGIYYAEWWKTHSPAADLILSTGLCGLSDFRALLRGPVPPILLYCHENQLTYPLQPGEARDYQFGFTDIVNCLVADRVWFNSGFHMNDFLDSAASLIQRMPDIRPVGAVGEIRRKSSVVYPGCHIYDLKPGKERQRREGPVRLVWNHRWEHDKGPDILYQALLYLKARNVPFRLAVTGESYRRKPPEFAHIRTLCEKEIDVFGFVGEKQDYLDILADSDIVISTARQENFGISVVEAVASGCFPVLPNSLSYPELVPEAFHSHVLYETPESLGPLLERHIADIRGFCEIREILADHYLKFDWRNRIREFDSGISEIFGY